MDQNAEIKLRLYNPETDKGFVFSSFLDGLYFGNDYYRAMEKGSYYRNYSAIVENLVNRPSVAVVMAVLSDDPDVILGYALVESRSFNGEPAGALKTDLLHWVFVKKAWRGKGIANMLVPKSVTTVTHLSKPGAAIAKKKGYTFDPFQI